MRTFDFQERLPAKISNSEIERHLSSGGHPVDIHVRTRHMTAGTTTIPGKARLGRIAAHGGDEVYYIVRGECVVEIPRHGKEFRLRQGEVFLIPAGQIHAPRNDAEGEVVIFWVCAPDWP